MNSGPQDDDAVRRMLAEGRARKAGELAEKKSEFTRWLMIGVPVLILLFGVCFVLRSEPDVESEAADASHPAAEGQGMSALNAVLENGGTPAASPEGLFADGNFVKKEDVEFASELINFLQPPGKSPAKEK